MDIYAAETRSLLRDGKSREAERGLREACDDDSKSALCLGVLLTELGRFEPPPPDRGPGEAPPPTDFAAHYLERVARDPDPYIRACANAYRALGIVHSRADIPAVTEVLGAARAAAEESEASRGHVRLMSGVVYQKRGRLREAYDDLVAARSTFKDQKHRLGEAAALDAMGQVLELKGRPHRALAYYARSLVQKSLERDLRGIALTLGQLGRLNLRLGYFDEALECFDEDLEICTRIGDTGGERRMKGDIFRTLIEAGRLDEAESAHAEARNCAGITERDRLLLQKDRARLLLAQARRHDPGPDRDRLLDAASREIDEAAKRLRPSLPDAFRAMFAGVKANVQLARGEIEQAIRGLESAVRSFRQREARGHHAEALRDLARAYRLNKMKANASVRAHYAHTVATRLGFPRLAHELKSELVRIDRMDDAIEWIETTRTSKRRFDERYVNRSRLAEGGQGTVDKAYDSFDNDTPVIIKRPKLEQFPDQRDRRRALRQLRQEAELTNRVARRARDDGEPCACPIRDLGRDDDGRFYIVMDYIEGQTLADRLTAKKRLEPGDLLPLARRLLRALQLIHDAGVTHRDLKPDNIIIDGNEHPVIVDFGIARLLGEKRLGEIAGTLQYAAPEQLHSHGLALRGSLHPRIDLYALGVMLYEAAAGELPVKDPDENTIEGWRRAKLHAKIPSLKDRGIAVPTAFSDLVQTLLRQKKGVLRSESADAAMEIMKTLS